jgi:hypothetical protein
MGFADSLLSTGERITHREKQHWFVFVWGARLTILAIIIAILLFWLRSNVGEQGIEGGFRTLLTLVTVVLFFAGLANLLWTIFRYMSQEYVITNRRVLQVAGVLNKESTDSSLEKINDARLRQSVFGRMFGFGDLDVMTAAEVGIEPFKMIKDPVEFKKQMLDAKHEFEVDMERQGWAPSPPARAPGEASVASPDSPTTAMPLPGGAAAAATGAGVSAAPTAVPAAPAPPDLSPDEVTRTLANLADLRDRGAISTEEYEAKKADLLGRL